MIQKTALLLIPILSLLLSCQTKVEPEKDVQEVDLTPALSNDTSMMLSDIANHIEYIPLETSSECVLGDYWNVGTMVLDNHIIVDRQKSAKDGVSA